MLDALCRTRPSDWWDLGDDGNRLAVGLCSVCPVLAACAESAGAPHGVIRAGVAYRDTGERCEVCPCGRPIPTRRDRGECFTCVPRFDIRLPRARGSWIAAEQHEVVVEKLAAGWSYRAIGTLLGVAGETVRGFARRNKLLAARPAA
jgi:hypothetical protein